MNNDGHSRPMTMRDYTVQLFDGSVDMNGPIIHPPLATCRVKDFWGGVYKQFIVRGTGDYKMRIARNGSLNTMVSGVFIDRIFGTSTKFDSMPLAWLGGVPYNPPQITEIPHSGLAFDAMRLWLTADESLSKQGIESRLTPARISAYRAAMGANSPPSLLENWQWNQRLWTVSARRQFDDTMDRGWEAAIHMSPNMVWENRTPMSHSANELSDSRYPTQ
jgi:hypothetical protein